MYGAQTDRFIRKINTEKPVIVVSFLFTAFVVLRFVG